MARQIALVLLFMIFSIDAYAQCAPGIPGAGNPGCIPPSAPNSPYNQNGQAGSAPLPQPAGHWEDRWAAVALDYESGKNGVVSDRVDESSATSAALEQCQSSGGTHCKLAIAYHNQCAAISQNAQTLQLEGATAANKDEAVKRAQSKCGDGRACKVIYNQCSLPLLVQ